MPLIFLHLFYKAIKDSTYIKDLKSRFGYIAHANTHPLWIHAVSLGEVIGVEPLVRILEKDNDIVITVTTGTGYRKAKEIFSRHRVSYAPWDFSLCVKLFLKRLSPKALIIFETEIWPNMILQSKKFGTKIALVNGRLNEKSFSRYKTAKGFFIDVLQAIDIYCVQTQTHLTRFEQLGVDPNKIRSLGSMKFDMQSTADNSFYDFRKYVLLASTHSDEEEKIIDILTNPSIQMNYKMIICPRHPERAQEVANICLNKGLKTALFSKVTNHLAMLEDDVVLIMDEIGYLHSLYKNAQFCILGGSFIAHGGHNIIEPAFHHCPVISGPHFFNFEAIFNEFIDAKACFIADNYAELLELISNLSMEDLEQVAHRASNIVQQHKGSAAKQAEVVQEVIQR
ncbi:MAG: 3-deoxy-D-manno-octulosonic acid transferase [Gammaproteobacteria bacterium]